jgi:CubicO group peptidase (beta-lactamase class C family)
MHRLRPFSRWFSVTVFAILAAPLSQVAVSAQGRPWRQYASPQEAGFSSDKLEAIRGFADSVRAGAVMAIYRGSVLVAWGDVTRDFEAHSVRKSLLSALYGTAVAEGKIDLDRTLAALGIDDTPGLTDVEKSARIRDLIAARSGVFLPAAYGADQDRDRPARGSHPPGTHWFYNNWDFNVAGVIFERLTGEQLYEAFARRIARPIGMEDYATTDGFLVREPGRSRHPAHTFRMSTRDLARFGQLYLQQGRWDGRQVVRREWVRESTRPHSEIGPGAGYGYMWWTYAAGSLPERYPRLRRHALYQARGTGGQAIFVIPGAELVVVVRGDTDHGRNVAGPSVWAIAEGILAAREGTPVARAALGPVTVAPLRSQLPAPEPVRFLTLERDSLARYVGDYELAPGAVARVFLYEGRLFINVPGQGEGELFAVSSSEFTLRVVPGVRVAFGRDSTGAVSGVEVTLGAERMRGRKLD